VSDLVKRLRIWAEYGFPNGTENAALDEAADQLERYKKFVAKVRGHADPSGKVHDFDLPQALAELDKAP